MDHLQTSGQLVLDDGAVENFVAMASLCSSIGVAEVRGEFGRGAVVTCLNQTGEAIAKGLINYSSGDARRIMRKGLLRDRNYSWIHRRA